MKGSSRHARRWLWFLVIPMLCVGCLRVCRGPLNDSASVRWWLFSSYGAQQICPEMLKRGAPLKLTSSGNTVGRFFPNSCRSEVNEGLRTVTVHFTGTGYAWTPVGGRVGFSAKASVEYVTDFYVGKSALYVWARASRILFGPEFQLGSVEYKAVDWATRETAVGYLAQTFGQQIMSSALAQGFTVVRTRDGDLFTLGLIQPPQVPVTPFSTRKGTAYVFGNETTEIHPEQVDFIGPIDIRRNDQHLRLRVRIESGTHPVEAIVYPHGPTDVWREALQLGTPLAPPPNVQAVNGFPIQTGSEQVQHLKLPPGLYFVVIDNSSQLGNVNPPWNPLSTLGASTTVLSYSAELVDDKER